MVDTSYLLLDFLRAREIYAQLFNIMQTSVYEIDYFNNNLIMDLAAILVSGVAGSGALAESFQYVLSYICAKFGACR